MSHSLHSPVSVNTGFFGSGSSFEVIFDSLSTSGALATGLSTSLKSSF